MILEINKKAILEEFELNPFKAYANYKVKKDMEAIQNGTYKSEPIPKDAIKIAQNEPENTGTMTNTLNNIHNHNNALDDAMKMLGH